MMLDSPQLISAGIILLSVIFIAWGGTFVLNSGSFNELQKRYFRAGHGHAGMLVTLGLLVMLIVGLADVPQPFNALSTGVLWAAILMPAGFFLSVLGKDPVKPGRLIVLLWLGVASLVIGLAGAGVGLIIAGLA